LLVIRGGKFLVRIEDTDQERSKQEYTDSIMTSLQWAGIEPDEPVVIQSAQIAYHRKVAEELVAAGKAYRCYCTVEELAVRLGQSAAEEGGYTQYDRRCYELKEVLDRPVAIRFKVPDGGPIIFNDRIRGEIQFDRDQIDDFIIVRSDGTPMYNFVVVLDDAAMDITHVLRGEDHISNTPKQLMLYEACGFKVPEFVHFSLILGSDGHRLSKRHGATSVLAYKQEGFLAAALNNYLVRLGWSHGDQELFTTEELIRYFSLEHMGKKGAIFDRAKLEWMNGIYIRQCSAFELIKLIEDDVDPSFKDRLPNWSTQTLEAIIDLYKERAKTLGELVQSLVAVHERPSEYVGICSIEQLPYLTAVHEALVSQGDHASEAIDQLLKEISKRYQVPFAKIAQPVRLAITGTTSSPGVGKMIALLSVEEVNYRITNFMNYLERSNEH